MKTTDQRKPCYPALPIIIQVRNDPERYEAFIREQFERELARDDSAISQKACFVYFAIVRECTESGEGG